MKRLEGKVALVTGASGGLGEAVARRFASEGAAVLIADLLTEKGERIAQEIVDDGGEARFHYLDVTSEDGWREAVATAVAWKGRLTTLVNNAGILNRTQIDGTSLASWNSVLAVNLTGPFLGIRAAAPAMRDAGGGAIVNVASIAAFIGYDDPAYSASKSGLCGLTRTAAMEYIDWGIRANAVSPGIMTTPFNAGGAHLEPWRRATPLGRYGKVEETANAILFLASDDASFITGEEIVVDGGFKAGGAARRVFIETQEARAGLPT